MGGPVSTFLYLQCDSHEPPIRSDGEVGQHLYDLSDIRGYIANRDLLAQIVDMDLGVNFDSHFASNAAYFLQKHRACKISIQDEYGKQYDTIGDSHEPIGRQ
ncbi:hypothetical protein SEA_Phreeze_86 [Mycobacterium phage Phreeze]|nr:hypothetical protein SEA_THUMB_88 [Mycobacterium phage Thumb]QDH84950.1 hypothetical protein SEA_Phreeze_86 [Mycobacterium phage Phreeze]